MTKVVSIELLQSYTFVKWSNSTTSMVELLRGRRNMVPVRVKDILGKLSITDWVIPDGNYYYIGFKFEADAIAFKLALKR